MSPRTRYTTRTSLLDHIPLRYYLEQRKITHLHFKVQRAETLDELAYDCAKYRHADEGARTTNEALWAAWEAEEASVLDASR